MPTLEDELRTAQQAKYQEEVAAGNQPIMVDNSEGTKDYKALKKVWMPLLVQDDTGNYLWSLAEIVEAMMPIIRTFAKDYSGMRASYQFDDAVSDGTQAVFNVLRNDKGVAPFGNYAAREIKHTIKKGSRGASIIPIPTRQQTYTDRYVTSLDKATTVDPGLTIGGTVPSDSGAVEKSKCPHCGGSGKMPDEVTGKEEPCGVCDGRGTLFLTQPRRSEPVTPDDKLQKREELSRGRAILQTLITTADLSPRQIEIFLITHGVEGLFDPGIDNSGRSKEATAVSRILAAADTILAYRAGDNPAPRTGLWSIAQEQSRTDEFQQIWNAAFSGSVDDPELRQQEYELDHKPFNPELPVSLQLSPLWIGMKDDRTKALIDKLMEAFGTHPTTGEPMLRGSGPGGRITKSKQFVASAIAKINERIDEARDELIAQGGVGDYSAGEMEECVNIIKRNQLSLILDNKN